MDADRFRALLRRLAAGDGELEAVTASAIHALRTSYQQPTRRYHDFAHIEHCLRQHDLARQHMSDPDGVELALWFHDAVYDVKACDNEARSAALCAEIMQPLLSPARLSRVRALIMVTAPGGEPASEDESFMHDIDLSAFARPWEQFRTDSEAVRREMVHLDDAEFVRRQGAFLRSLLAQQSIYRSAFFRERCESAARANITRWLKVLDRRLAPGA